MSSVGPYESDLDARQRAMFHVPPAELWRALIVGEPLEGVWHCYHVGHLHHGNGPRVGDAARELARRGIALLAQRRLPNGENGFSYLIMKRGAPRPQPAPEPEPIAKAAPLVEGGAKQRSARVRHILEAYDNGQPITEIARIIGEPYANVYNALKYHGRIKKPGDAAGRVG